MKYLIVSAVAIAALATTFLVTGPSESEAGRSYNWDAKVHPILVRNVACYNMAKVFKDKPDFYYNVKYDAQYGGWTCFYGYKGHRWGKPL